MTMIAWPWHRPSTHRIAAAVASAREAQRQLEEAERIRDRVRACQPAIQRDLSGLNQRTEVNHLGKALMKTFERKRAETDDS